MNKRVLGNSIIYVFNQVLLKAFGFFLLPLYTAYLTTTDYGTTNLIASFTAVAGFIVVFSLFSAVSRFYVEYKHDLDKVRRLFGTLLIFSLVSGLTFFVFAVFANRFMTETFFQSVPFFPIILVALLGLVFNNIHQMYASILRAMQEAKRYFITNLAYFFLQLSLNLLFVVKMEFGALGVVMASLIANITFFVYVFFDLRKRKLITLCIDLPILKETLKYSIPIIPHNLSTTIAQLVSKILINNQFALSFVGIYGLASQFGSLADTVQSSTNVAVQPWLFTQIHEGRTENKQQISQMSYLITWLSGIVFLGIAFFSQEVILLLINPTYGKAWTVVPLLVAAYAIKSMYYPYINLLFYEKKASRKIFIATISSSLINIVLSAILIPKWDMYGSAIADIAAMIIRVAIVVYMAGKHNIVGYRLWEFSKSTLVVLAFMIFGLYLSYTKWPNEVSLLNIAFKVMILLAYTAIAFYANKGVSRKISIKKALRREL